MKTEVMDDFYGHVLYDIEKDGCLNGVFTNTGVNGRIFNEIARRRTGTDINDPLLGDYALMYIDEGNTQYTGSLQIASDGAGGYLFSWFDSKGKQVFKGTGARMSDSNLVAYYTTV